VDNAFVTGGRITDFARCFIALVFVEGEGIVVSNWVSGIKEKPLLDN
jgi:hypothetical protein